MVETEIDKLIRMFGDETTQMDARQIAESVDIAKEFLMKTLIYFTKEQTAFRRC